MYTPKASKETLEKLTRLSSDSSIQRVHVLGWRDLEDAEAGGSELHAHCIFSIWAQAGISVMYRSSHAPGLPDKNIRAGYEVVRKSNRYVVFIRSAVSQIFKRNGNYDALIEIWNGVPFLSPIWCRKTKNIWLHHVHGPMWKDALPAGLSKLGEIMEKRFAPLFYRKSKIVTLSKSSESEIIEEMKLPKKNIIVVNPGIDNAFKPGDKSSSPFFLAVGRLAPVKNFERLIAIAVKARKRNPDFTLTIIGDGPDREKIIQLLHSLNAETFIHLKGHITDAELLQHYQEAWCLLSASTREGWGMTITEAAACATPAIVSNIAGHSDALSHNVSGVLCASDEEFVETISQIIQDDTYRQTLSISALEYSHNFTWEKAAIETFQYLVDAKSTK